LFNSLRYHSLVFGARTGLAARANVAFFGNIFSEKVGLFVVNGQCLIGTELTELGLGEETAITASFWSPLLCSSIFSHVLLQSFSVGPNRSRFGPFMREASPLHSFWLATDEDPSGLVI